MYTNALQQQERDKANQKGFKHDKSFEENLKAPGTFGPQGDEIIASIEAPIADKFAARKSREQSIERKRSSEREVIEYNKSNNRRSGYEDVSDDGKSKANKKKSGNLDRQSSGVKKTKESDNADKEGEAPSTQQKPPLSQRCPFWLKVLIAFLVLVALGGIGYWFFFKRGKKDEKKIKTFQKVDPHIKTSHPIPITDSKVEVKPAVVTETTTTIKNETSPSTNPNNASATVTVESTKTPSKDLTETNVTKTNVKVDDGKQVKQVKQTKETKQSVKPVAVEVTAKHLRQIYY